MGRSVQFEDRQVFVAIGRELGLTGQLSIQGIVKGSGLSTGSLYHRFSSREGMLADAWLYTIDLFQQRFLSALATGGIIGGIEAALATPRFCREEPDLAPILVNGRSSEFIGGPSGATARERLDHMNRHAAEQLCQFASNNGLSVLTCQLALVALPLGAVRLLPSLRTIPEELDVGIGKAAAALLGSQTA